MQNEYKFSKRNMQKILQERLKILIQSLTEAETGSKGIDLLKEIKELHNMLLDVNNTKQNTKNTESTTEHIFSWVDAHNKKNDTALQQSLQANSNDIDKDS